MITEKRLRNLIRSVLLEQVVGYQAPQKSYDDPMGDDDHDVSVPTSGGTSSASSGASSTSSSTDSSDSGSSDGGGYLSVGDMGVDTSLTNPNTDEKQASANQVRTLTKQRQDALNKGDTVDADNAGQQLKMARKMRG